MANYENPDEMSHSVALSACKVMVSNPGPTVPLSSRDNYKVYMITV